MESSSRSELRALRNRGSNSGHAVIRRNWSGIDPHSLLKPRMHHAVDARHTGSTDTAMNSSSSGLWISITFEFEKPKFGLLGKAKKKLATCKVEKEVKGKLKPCSFKTSEASAVKSFNLWWHVKRNHPENYAALVTKKDQEDEAKQKADAAKRCSSGTLKTLGEKIFCGTSSEKKPKIDQTKIDSYLKSSKVTVTMDANTFHEGLMEMVCLSSTLLTTFRLKNKEFQKIAGEMGRQLGVLMGHNAVRHLVVGTAQSGHEELKKALEQKLCYLKIDAATRGNRNFLTINAQYDEEGKDKVVVKTLDINRH
ncbi:hypothetical protein UY3_17765 [Chelonia mydas]|uniref:Uncharacterized protein n=1 Tax=Chelonia mydas TaxID=8469 RepID=M7AKW4_CHEMY|nr:hypothetical protein UY3_17765 [Chelonia mydas]